MRVTTVVCCNTFVKAAYKQKCYNSVCSVFDCKFQHQHWNRVTPHSFLLHTENSGLRCNAARVLNKLAVLLILITESLLIYHG